MPQTLDLPAIFENFTQRLTAHFVRNVTCETPEECRALAEQAIETWKQYDMRSSEYNGTAHMLHAIERRIQEKENGIHRKPRRQGKRW